MYDYAALIAPTALRRLINLMDVKKPALKKAGFFLSGLQLHHAVHTTHTAHTTHAAHTTHTAAWFVFT